MPMRQIGRFRVNHRGRLIIIDVSGSDQGLYRCLAQSFLRQDSRLQVAASIGTLRLHVISSSPPLFPSLVRHFAVEQGGNFIHPCVAEVNLQVLIYTLLRFLTIQSWQYCKAHLLFWQNMN